MSQEDVSGVWQAWEKSWLTKDASQRDRELRELWGVLCDWYKQREPDFYAGLERLVARGYRPYRSEGHYPPDQPTYAWYDASRIERELGSPHSNLPARFYALLQNGRVQGKHHAYDTALEAWEDAVLAVQLGEAGGQQSLSPAEEEAQNPLDNSAQPAPQESS